MRRFVLLPMICCVSALSASSARADGGMLAIVNLRVDLAESERPQVRATIEAAVKKAGLELVPELEVQHMQTLTPEPFNCFIEDRCRVEVGKRLQADYLLTGTIGKEDDAYVVQLDVFDVQLATVKREPAACAHCSAQAFDKRLSALVENGVRAARQSPRATLVVRTRPPGAEVKIDQRPVGVSNLELVVSPGTHTVELGGAGRSPISMPVEVKAKERREVDLKMTVQQGAPTAPQPEQHPAPPPLTTQNGRPPEPPPTPREPWWRPQRIAGVTLMAGGAALALASIGPFAIDRDCSVEGHCLYQQHTKGAGIGLAVAGGALAVAGLVVVLTTPRHHLHAAVSPFVSGKGAGVVGAVRF